MLMFQRGVTSANSAKIIHFHEYMLNLRGCQTATSVVSRMDMSSNGHDSNEVYGDSTNTE